MIVINIDKAKNIAHEMRRASRSVKFAPLDVKVTIPFEAAKAEQERQSIRDRYAAMQVDIDNAKTIDELKSIVSSLTQ
jgi:hypothetical protein